MATPESEYVAMVVVDGVLFLLQVERFTMPSLEQYSASNMDDHHGVMKFANNPLSGERARHVNIEHHVVQDAVKNIIFSSYT